MHKEEKDPEWKGYGTLRTLGVGMTCFEISGVEMPTARPACNVPLGLIATRRGRLIALRLIEAGKLRRE